MRMAEIFVDTTGWANFFVRTEPFHDQTAMLMRQWRSDGTRLVTTNYILLELAALLTSPLRIPRPQLIKTIETILMVNWVEIVHIEAVMHDDAWRLLAERPDKLWSWVDCVSFVVMRERQITKSLTTDHHFEQAGFVRLLK